MSEDAAKCPPYCSDRDLEIIKQSEAAQGLLKKNVLQRSVFSEAERQSVQFTEIEQFRTYWTQITAAQDCFEDAHKTGCGLFARRYQSSAELVLGFMDDFNPIVTAVKNFAAPYGGLAIGVISLVFVKSRFWPQVAQKKDTVEKTLASTIAEIRKRLPGIDLYRHIYDEDHPLDHAMQAQIVAAYQSFIKFCIVAVDYYKSYSAQLRDQLTNGDKDAFEQTFKLDIFSEELHQTELAAYSQDLANDPDFNYNYLHQLHGTGLDNFMSSGRYKQWDHSFGPCLLILSGRNYMGLPSPQCWLSRVAIATIERQRAFSSAYCAHYIIPLHGATLYQVLPSILLQLLAKKKNMLRMDDQRDGLRAELHAFRKAELSAIPNKYGNDSKTDALMNIARRVVGFFDAGDEVYIVVDRVDLCTDHIGGYDHRKSLLEGLVQMGDLARCRLRTLVVINRSLWNFEDHQCELTIPVPDRLILHRMDQTPFTPPPW
ncbi:hypothetical protein N7495_010052 [Penicillium taxi]|uniref:uncharacterized protein n=1 Tax=Penicillium taxi TaxID=168475 RepID=UPI0025452DAC|nr:uncharacterized protein N7495_010052 [Penicillium taxi]KAJ5885542.1 hypothetical protein N7495_010052 [Penicillium taxi]